MRGGFAALEMRANAAVIDHLANREVLVAPSISAEPFGGIFEDAGALLLDDAAEASQPRLTVSLADAVKLPHNTAITLRHPVTLVESEYVTVSSDPDGAGFMVYALRKAS